MTAARIVALARAPAAWQEAHARRHPELADAPAAVQLAALQGDGFGPWGHAALTIVSNGEGGDPDAMLEAQLRQLQPDLLLLHDLALLQPDRLARLRPQARRLVGCVGSTLPAAGDLSGLDLVTCRYAHQAEALAAAGLPTMHLPPAFDARWLGAIGARQPVLPFTHVGAPGAATDPDTQWLAGLAALAPLQRFGPGGEVWGLDRLRQLRASRVTLNRHPEAAGRFAGNRLLFDATGCGALLLTDYRDDLAALFEIGDELLAYRSPEECADLVSWALAHPEQAEVIARAGQARTLRDHGPEQRLAALAERLEGRGPAPRRTISLPTAPAAAPPLRWYCSYFDRNYLARALVLLESLEKHEPRDFRFIVVCLDEFTRLALKALNHPRVIALSRHELEQGDEALVGPRAERTLAEYYWTLSPTAILQALRHVPEGEPLIYLDADLCFHADPAEMLAEMDGHSVLIHEHRFSPEFRHLESYSGRFNVGLMGFRNDARGRTVLQWWRERCNEWCFARSEGGKFGDQMYLNDWPTRFEGVRVIEHPGAGVAPWNQTGLQWSEGRDAQGAPQPRVNGRPLVFFHFHAQVPMNPQAYLFIKYAGYRIPDLALRHAYAPYVLRQEHWADWLRTLAPQLRSGYWPQQALFPGAALMVRDALGATLTHVERQSLVPGWTLLPGTQIMPSATEAAAA